MVRRWSRINDTNLNFINFTKFEKRLKVSSFKSAVFFKRFTYKKTKFRRKFMARFKHNTNWLMYTNVIKIWVTDYRFHRNYAKIQFLQKIFINNLYVYNFNFTKIRNDLFSYNFNFFFSVWAKKSYWYFNRKDTSKFKFNNLTFIWYNAQPVFGNSVIPVGHEWDNLMYPHKTKKLLNNYNLDNLFQLLFNINLNKIIEFKKILTLLYFNELNIKKVK